MRERRLTIEAVAVCALVRTRFLVDALVLEHAGVEVVHVEEGGGDIVVDGAEVEGELGDADVPVGNKLALCSYGLGSLVVADGRVVDGWDVHEEEIAGAGLIDLVL